MPDFKDVQERLRSALMSDEPDISKVLRLSHELAAHDSKHVRFTVDASHILRLGRELVARQETALAELVKNGYDADAVLVDLLFKDADKPGGTLEVWDNGLGMDREQLVNGFMRISTAEKIDKPFSARFGRRRAGRKGIGRFAAQRLGSRLTVITKMETMPRALKVTIDWNAFVPHEDISLIESDVEEIEVRFKEGTRLFISDLQDAWSDAQIRRSARYVADLIQPFPLDQGRAIPTHDLGFKATFAREGHSDLEIVSDDWTLYFQHALAEVEGRVDSSGHGFFSLHCSAYGIDEIDIHVGPEREMISSFSDVRNVRFRAFYFVSNEISKQARGVVRNKLSEIGGIRLYRNGFRVLPYGEAFDDWLGLDASSRGRSILPPHANFNFLGFVEVSDAEGKLFEETASREGLVENDAYRQLREFVFKSLIGAVTKVAEARGRKVSSGDSKRRPPNPLRDAQDIAANIEAVADAPSSGVAKNEVRKELDTIRDRVLELGRQGELLLEENGLLRVLASLGITIGEFTHEVALGFAALDADIQNFLETVQQSEETKVLGQRMLSQLRDLESYVGYFDTILKDNVARDLVALEIRDVVQAFQALVEPRLKRQRLELTLNIKGVGLFVRPMHRSEWSSILINLFTNAAKAVKRAQVPGKILISAGREGGKIYLDFADNGDGIPKANAPYVFDAFFTTTSAAPALGLESDRLTGMGLGLKIVRDIVLSAGGEINLVPPPIGYTTCFRVLVPSANEEEVGEDAY